MRFKKWATILRDIFKLNKKSKPKEFAINK